MEPTLPNMAIDADHDVDWTRSPDNRAIRVLLVEDSTFQRIAIEALCSAVGYVVQTAASGEEVLALLARHSTSAPPPWDLVLCDVMLQLDGISGVPIPIQVRVAESARPREHKPVSLAVRPPPRRRRAPRAA